MTLGEKRNQLTDLYGNIWSTNGNKETTNEAKGKCMLNRKGKFQNTFAIIGQKKRLPISSSLPYGLLQTWRHIVGESQVSWRKK